MTSAKFNKAQELINEAKSIQDQINHLKILENLNKIEIHTALSVVELLPGDSRFLHKKLFEDIKQVAKNIVKTGEEKINVINDEFVKL